LTVEMADVMGGRQSRYFQKYLDLCAAAFRVARRHGAKVARMMEIMQFKSNYPAFRYSKCSVLSAKVLIKCLDTIQMQSRILKIAFIAVFLITTFRT
jgi:hypothetical protein